MNKFVKIGLGFFLITTLFLGFVADRFEEDNKNLRASLENVQKLNSIYVKSYGELRAELEAEKQVCGGISRSKVEAYELNQATLEAGLSVCRKDKVSIQKRLNKLIKEAQVQ
jgi:hypothetical protein